MFILLLSVIYLAFISLGLPDSLLGSAWPIMYLQLHVPVSFAGIISMVIAGGTIVSSLMSYRLTKKFGTGLVTAVSILLTAAALFGFSVSTSFAMLIIFAVPYGLGAGAIDAALNNFVALHYNSRHMSWLHCFWGIGASLSPYIMSFSLTRGYGWNNGYRMVSIIQIFITAIVFLALPLFKKQTQKAEAMSESKAAPKKLTDVFKIKGVFFILFAFFGYCALESTAMLWASSYLAIYRGIDAKTAAMFASLFCLGITAGRFLCGFVADKIGDKNLIRIGSAIMALGIIIVLIPVKTEAIALIGLVIAGLGCAPIYPSIIHATPTNFGAENSQAIVGLQMASAYSGSTFMPPLFGLIARNTTFAIFPFYLLVFAAVVIIMTEKLNRLNKSKEAA